LTLPACTATIVGDPSAAASASISAPARIAPLSSTATGSMQLVPRPSMRSARSIVT
jgi:hypothetical protein